MSRMLKEFRVRDLRGQTLRVSQGDLRIEFSVEDAESEPLWNSGEFCNVTEFRGVHLVVIVAFRLSILCVYPTTYGNSVMFGSNVIHMED